MNQNIKVSIILPSLNVVTYIKECIESVINQTLRDIEIICVDAGSTDGTLEVLKEYSEKDKRIKILISDVKSYGVQMNLGIHVAKGKYIGIVETDDYVPQEMFEELYLVAEKNDVDFVKADLWRFTGKGENLKKVLYQLSDDLSYYNRIVNVSEEKRCFLFCQNTWSGIYKKEFLDKYSIQHNTTLGASYQDNGFWFQTFMYAKRAYFINKPYYMNRRDNPGSSVYNKNKIFCICEEYDYILDTIQKEQVLFEEFKFVFSFFCYRAYKATLEKIRIDDKKEFLLRFSEVFHKYVEKGYVDFDMFSDAEKNVLFSILDDPLKYYEEVLVVKDLLYYHARKYENVIIYGAGGIGKQVHQELTYRSDPVDVLCFAVSDKKDNKESLKGLPICEIKELTNYRENTLVIVATLEIYQKEIVDVLVKYGFKNYKLVPESSMKQMFYWGMKLDEYKNRLMKWYELVTGSKLGNKTSFLEKQQLLKISEKNKRGELIDRLNMREWISERIGNEYLVPVLGIYDTFENIDWDKLPENFVLRYTHGYRKCFFVNGIENKMAIVSNKVTRRRVKSILKENAENIVFLYDYSAPKIIVEEIVENKVFHDNYKVVCFDGVPKYILYDMNSEVWGGTRRNIYNTNWERIEASIKYPPISSCVRRPKHMSEMNEIAKQLSQEFKLCVIQFFDTDGKLYVDKISFSLGQGIEKVEPLFFEKELSELVNL